MATFKNTLDSLPTALVDMGLNAANDAVGSLINNAFYKKNAKYQFELNEQSAENAYQRQLDFWNKQNEYNDPSSQVSRLRKAGLNPAIMNGGVAGNTAGGLSSVSAGSVAGAPSSSSKHVDFLSHVANRLNLEHLDYENKILSEQLKSHQSDNLRRAIEDGDYATAHELRMQMLADDREFKRLSNEEKENKIKSDLIDLGWKQDAADDGVNPLEDTHNEILSRISLNNASETEVRERANLARTQSNELVSRIRSLSYDNQIKEANSTISQFFNVPNLSSLPSELQVKAGEYYYDYVSGKFTYESTIDAFYQQVDRYIEKNGHIPYSTSESRSSSAGSKFISLSDSNSRSVTR